MFKKLLLLYISLSVAFRYGKASSDDTMNEFTGVFLECMKEYPITKEDLDQLQKDVMPNNDNSKCLFACVYKKTGMMNERGELSIEGVKAKSNKYFGNDATKIKNSTEFAEVCKKVNDVPVKDGTKGCERAARMFKCSIENASKFGLV